jgi:hypothetical protein
MPNMKIGDVITVRFTVDGFAFDDTCVILANDEMADILDITLPIDSPTIVSIDYVLTLENCNRVRFPTPMGYALGVTKYIGHAYVIVVDETGAEYSCHISDVNPWD